MSDKNSKEGTQTEEKAAMIVMSIGFFLALTIIIKMDISAGPVGILHPKMSQYCRCEPDSFSRNVYLRMSHCLGQSTYKNAQMLIFPL